MTENALAVPGVGDIQKHDEAEFMALAAAGQAYLPRIQVGGSTSNVVKENKLPMGHWGLLSGDTVTDLGESVDCLVLSWQPKAMDVSGDPIITSTNQHSETYKAIQAKSTVPDSGCMWGPEYLVYLPEEEVFASLFLASKTARREASNIQALLGRGATLKIQYIKKLKYSWHGPIIIPCSAVFDPPDKESIIEAHKKFVAVQDAEVEVVAETEERAR